MTEQNTEADTAGPDVGSSDTEGVAQIDTPDGGDISDVTPEGSDLESEQDPETFPREYVEKLRTENGKYRQRASEADSLANRLHTELVRATGKLADPTDLPFDAEHLEDTDKLSVAINELLETKPHLATRRPSGDIGQGQRGPATGSFSLLGMLKERT
ncbi:hypothetical protein [Mycolicibacterium alvei]|uniref:Scaffolding protein n=1 Tax=Mycolicibacterium alvei TaxID=67081 RepID=A0A6N4V0X3_9MYCO|nr:hypothetical protein [Mycolicibacterium alvei]MCV7000299.1 hypothetical protein [Mycolicibacterium alvei]BBX29311.1 hypothetical protein MALV_44360 [Mycolicibacterium alvei]